MDPSHFAAACRFSMLSALPISADIISIGEWLRLMALPFFLLLVVVSETKHTLELRISLLLSFLSFAKHPRILKALLHLATWTNMRRSDHLHTLLDLQARQALFALTLAPNGGKIVSAISSKDLAP